MRVLIAEDSPVSRKLLETILRKWGYEVVVVETGTDAADVLTSPNPPRLAILDWMMPGMDGADVCRAVRARVAEPYIYLLLLTAKSTKDDIIEGLRAGADDYLTKPFDSSELELRVIAGKRVLDLQSELVRAREALHEKATRDSLTGLPNRLLFGDRLVHNLAQARRREEKLAIMFIDLDSFKYVNDTLGHSIGDLLLASVAERLTDNLRDVDTIARMGGDEFTIIQTQVNNHEDAINVASKALRAFEEPFVIESHEVFVSASIGISIYPDDGPDAETIVRNADMAMYQAKSHGPNSFHLYTRSLDHASARRVSIENSLRKALERGEFVLHYQPRLSIATGLIVGAEALLRWNHHQHGLVMPDEFIPIAEETGLITPIGEWVLKTACRQNKLWQEMGLPPIELAVNVSIRQIRSGDFRRTVQNALSEAGLSSEFVGIELTESALAANPERTIAVLQELKDMGVRIYIDDFGTGYSSLSYLKKLPINAIKVDRTFISDLTLNQDDSAIVRAIVAMAHSMKLRVTAEGVETLDQLAFLKVIGCDEMQGYFVSRPVPAECFEELLRRGNLLDCQDYPKAA